MVLIRPHNNTMFPNHIKEEDLSQLEQGSPGSETGVKHILVLLTEIFTQAINETDYNLLISTYKSSYNRLEIKYGFRF